MDIAALSMSLSQVQVAQQASKSIMKKAIDTDNLQIVDTTQMLESNTKIIEG